MHSCEYFSMHPVWFLQFVIDFVRGESFNKTQKSLLRRETVFFCEIQIPSDQFLPKFEPLQSWNNRKELLFYLRGSAHWKVNDEQMPVLWKCTCKWEQTKTHCWSCLRALLQWQRRQSPRTGQSPGVTVLLPASSSLFEEGVCPRPKAPLWV